MSRKIHPASQGAHDDQPESPHPSGEGRQEFEIPITRSSLESVGLKYSHVGGGHCLRIEHIEEGSPVWRHNQDLLDTGFHQVVPGRRFDKGDEILSVNGHSDWLGMDNELRTSPSPVIRLRKMTSSAAQTEQSEDEKFQKLLHKLNVKLNQEEILEESTLFKTGSMTYAGRAVHAAACSQDLGLLRRLIDKRARVNEECVCEGHLGKMAGCRFQPIHLAADLGIESNLIALLEAKANPNAYVTDGERRQFTALCQVARRGNDKCMKILLEQRANPGLKHSDGQSPLHIASGRGHPQCVKLLVEHRADLSVENVNQFSPLEVAMNSNFPDKDLFLLAQPTIRDLLQVAQDAPCTAAEMLQGGVKWDRAKLRESARGKEGDENVCCPCVKDLMAVMENSPRVASLLVDLLTCEPAAKYDYPLPRRSKIKSFSQCTRLLEYTDQRAWGWRHSQSQCFGDDLFCKTESKKRLESKKTDLEKTRSVNIRVLLVQNVMDFKFLDALVNLSTPEDMQIFQRPAIQALVEFMWKEHVWPSYRVNQIVSLLEVLILGWLVIGPPEDQDQRRISWTLLTASTARCAWIEAAQLFISIKHAQTSMAYFKDWWNYMDLAIIVLLTIAIVGAVPSLAFQHHELLALVSLFRWIQLLCSVAQVAKVGYMVMPLFRSLYEVRGISMVVVFVFLGFLHAFIALDSQQSGTGSADPVNIVTLNAFRLLFLGDGDGIDYVLHLGLDEEQNPDGTFVTQSFLYCGAIVFSVLIMNLFIAVHGQAYEAEAAAKTENFYKNWACVCHGFYLMPIWRLPMRLPMQKDKPSTMTDQDLTRSQPPDTTPEKDGITRLEKALRRLVPLMLWVVFFVVGILVCLCLLLLVSVPPLVCALLLAGHQIVSDMVLRGMMVGKPMEDQIFTSETKAQTPMYLKWCSWTVDERMQQRCARESEATLPKLHNKMEKWMSQIQESLDELRDQQRRDMEQISLLQQRLQQQPCEKAPHESEVPEVHWHRGTLSEATTPRLQQKPVLPALTAPPAAGTGSVDETMLAGSTLGWIQPVMGEPQPGHP